MHLFPENFRERVKLDERNEITKDYFKLHILLNRANKKANLKTKILFVIRNLPDQIQFVATLNETAGNPSIELCVRRPNQKWKGSDSTGLYALEKFCANRLELNLVDGKWLSNKDLCERIAKKLASLGIMKD